MKLVDNYFVLVKMNCNTLGWLQILPTTTKTKYIRVIPQGTVDNNLGSDRLAGPKALDPNYCRQPTL